jgi:hypothetical protein
MKKDWLPWLTAIAIAVVYALVVRLMFDMGFLTVAFAPLEKVRSRKYRAPAATIWANVVRVRAIPEAADHGPLTLLLGFPRPVRAELNYAGVGGRRQAIFSKGLVFEEVVREYDDQKRMVFSIKADPHAIPSTTMDKHVVIGGDSQDHL